MEIPLRDESRFSVALVVFSGRAERSPSVDYPRLLSRRWMPWWLRRSWGFKWRPRHILALEMCETSVSLVCGGSVLERPPVLTSHQRTRGAKSEARSALDGLSANAGLVFGASQRVGAKLETLFSPKCEA